MTELLVISNVLLWILCLVLGVFVFALARQVGVLYERVAPAGALAMNRQITAGTAAPEIGATDLAGSNVRIGGRSSDGRSTLLFFVSPTCVVCKSLLPAVRALAATEKQHVRVVFASDGELEDHAGFVREQRLEAFDYVVSEVLGRAYGIAKLPYAVLIGTDGMIAALGLINSREHLDSLLEAQTLGVTSIQEYLGKTHASSVPQTQRP